VHHLNDASDQSDTRDGEQAIMRKKLPIPALYLPVAAFVLF
jgi:hypothetical protein